MMTTHLDIPLEAVLFRTADTQPLIEIRFEKVGAVGGGAVIDQLSNIVPCGVDHAFTRFGKKT